MTPKEVRAAKALCKSLDEAGISTLTEARVLFAATEGDELPNVGDLVKRTGLPWSTVSRVGWMLVEGGWFKYEVDPTDRRVRGIRVNLERLA